MGTPSKRSPSRAFLMAATRPSIMSEGATMCAPARACDSAIFASSSRVGSFCTSPDSTTPQWPCEVYSQRHTSVMTSRSRHSERIARTALCTIPSSA